MERLSPCLSQRINPQEKSDFEPTSARLQRLRSLSAPGGSSRSKSQPGSGKDLLTRQVHTRIQRQSLSRTLVQDSTPNCSVPAYHLRRGPGRSGCLRVTMQPQQLPRREISEQQTFARQERLSWFRSCCSLRVR